MIKDKRIAIAFRSICLLIILMGLMLQLNVFSGNLSLSNLMYYTLQSNILAFFMFCLLLIKTTVSYVQEGKYGETGSFARFEMVCAVNLLLTLVVYWVLLAPLALITRDSYNIFTFENLSVHLLAPLFCLIDYILFSESGQLKYRDVYAVLIFPFLYLVFTSAAGFMGYVYRVSSDGKPVRFPYFFYDYDEVKLKAFLYIGAIFLLLLLFAHVFYWLDKRLRIKNFYHRIKRIKTK